MREAIDKAVSWTLVFLMGIMTIDVLWGVFTRKIIGHQSSFTEELARFLLIWIGILGAAYVAGKRMHLAIDLLPTKLEGKRKKRLLAFINLIIILFATTVLVIGGIRYVYITFSLGQISPALQVPMGIVYLVVPISGLLVVYYKIMDIIHPPFP